eukprot:s1653_g4.t1
MVARKIASSLAQGQESSGYPKSEGRKEGRKEECQHDMQKLHVHLCYLYNGPKRGDKLVFLTCTKCQKTFHEENHRELVTCAWDGNGKQYADTQKPDVRKEVEECEMRNSTLEGQIQLQDGQNCRARLNFDGHSSFHPWLKVYQSNFVGGDTEFHINNVNYQGTQVFLELDEPRFGGLKHSRVEFLSVEAYLEAPKMVARKIASSLAQGQERSLRSDWPALMTCRLMSPEVFHERVMGAETVKESDFYGSVSFEEGPHVKTIVSFPGQYKEDWQCLVRRSIKRTAFEMDRDYQPPRTCTQYAAGSTACVFLPEGSKFHGGHPLSYEDTHRCWCDYLYDGVKAWGCHWFVEWQRRLHDAVKKGHTLVVVYKAGQTGRSKEGLEWPPKIPSDQDHAALGVSQRGEVSWLMRHSMAFVEEDIDDYRRRLIADIEAELRELKQMEIEGKNDFMGQLNSELRSLKERTAPHSLI